MIKIEREIGHTVDLWNDENADKTLKKDDG